MDNRRHGGPRRRKVCQFCADKSEAIDYKDVEKLKKYVTERGKILPKRITGTCATSLCCHTSQTKQITHIKSHIREPRKIPGSLLFFYALLFCLLRVRRIHRMCTAAAAAVGSIVFGLPADAVITARHCVGNGCMLQLFAGRYRCASWAVAASTRLFLK